METTFKPSSTPSNSTVMASGIRGVFNPAGKSYYVLEHFSTSKFHQAGEQQKIVVDCIEIGRDARCQVRFDDDFNTVSRRHAAIIRDGDRWKLLPISTTNATLVNGKRITSEEYLHSGDEIQVSLKGPKLRFVIPGNADAGGNLGDLSLTARLHLYSNQALKPYRRALLIGGIALLLAIGGLVATLLWMRNINNEVESQAASIAQLIRDSGNNQQRADSLARELARTNGDLSNAINQIKTVEDIANNAVDLAGSAYAAAGPAPGAFRELSSYIYYIQIEFRYQGDPLTAASGTAFLLSDGRMVTARHCVDFAYNSKEELLQSGWAAMLNSVINFQPQDCQLRICGISGNGSTFDVTFHPNELWTMGNTEFTTDCIPVQLESGEIIECPVRYMTNMVGGDDWAYFRTDKRGGLAFDPTLSNNLSAGTKVQILGFPVGMGTETINVTGAVNPVFSQAAVSTTGLYTDGIILLDNNDVEHGNSGGPVFTLGSDLKPVVIGLVSGAEIQGLRVGNTNPNTRFVSRIVPISAIK